MDIEITSQCNLQCTYCYYFNNPEVKYQELPTEQWLQFFAELGRAAVMDVCLAGGETFTRKDLPQLIEGIVSNNMRFSILSNGTLIDKSIAAFISKTNRCNGVQISIDGSCAEIHDTCRGIGSFDRAVTGIKILQEQNIPITIRVTLHRKNIADLDNIARFLLDELQLKTFTTNAAGYLGTCRNNPELMLSTTDRERAMTTLLRLSAKYPGQISAQAGPLADAQLWTAMVKARNQNKPSKHNGGYLTGCGCPWSTLTVRSDGVLIPCSMLSHLRLGTINQDSFVDVWQKSKKLHDLRERKNIPLASFKFCNDCRHIQHCTGNCPGLAYSLTGQINHPSPDACLKRFTENGGTLPQKKMHMSTAS